MDEKVLEKLKILAESAKYDVSCASSGTSRSHKSGAIGSAAGWGICHSFAEDGRCISLLKIMLTNYCMYDCAYCINRRSNDLPRATLSVTELVNPMGMRSSVVLSDGTKVILNAGTTLSYPAAFVSGQREVKVNGEAFFEVSHDKEHPFIVSAENVKVKVLGTKFNVKAYDDDDNIEVTLAEGKVGVGLDTKNLIQIMPGQQIKYMKASHRFIKREVRLQSYTAWVCGKFYFTNYPLEKIAKQLERSFNVRIQILGDDLRKAAFTGDFVRGENIDQILRVMTANRPIRYEIEGDQITISKK